MKRYSISEAAERSGLTVHMIGYLCRIGAVIPIPRRACTRGSKRQFRSGDIVVLRTLCRLLQAGVSVKRIKEALNDIEVDDYGYFKRRILVTDGKEIYFVDSHAEIGELTTSSGQFIFGFVLDTYQLRDGLES